MFFASIGAGVLTSLVVVYEQPINVATMVLCGLLSAVGVLGVLTAIWGCDRCVVRMFGGT
ncbi:MAG: hypothetical protein AAF351_06865 [Pseudomonadota bacterium]